jgi:hypothetical protein
VTPNPLLASLLALTGQSEADLSQQANLLAVPVQRWREVPDTKELRRILALPRRSLDSGEELARAFTAACRTPWGQWTLRPIQALALKEICEVGGAFCPINAGGGKTLLSYLAPAFAQAARPVLIVPAALREKTRKEFRQLAQHFLGPHPEQFKILSYQELGRTTAGSEFDKQGRITRPGLLEKLRPDMLIMDEVHKVKRDTAAVTKRVKRFLKANPGCKVVAMSGTVTKRSLKDYAHIARWCLPHTCPVPQTDDDLEAWAAALDEKVQAFQRLDPGALRLFVSGYFPDPETDPEGSLAAARQAYRARLVETPGVVATQDGALGTSLVISPWGDGGKCPKIEEAFGLLRDKGATPDGQLFADPLTLARHARSLCLGVWYKWRVQPPEEWLLPRRAWASECRSLIKANRRGLDSEKHIVQHLHLYPESKPIYDEWAAVRATFEPETVPEWISDEALNWAIKWLEDGPGIIWTKHAFWGLELARRTGLPYYRQGGLNAQKQAIEDHPANKSLIASVDSNGTGRNLQKWHRNLLVSGLANGEQYEQLLARTHRPGQEEDEVEFDLYLGCAETLLGFNQARADCRYTQDSIGQAQRLCYADVLVPDAVHDGTARWSK